MRTGVMCLASLALTLTVLGNAWHQRQQFYPSVVYITKSNPSMAVIYLQSFVVVLLLGKVMRKIFFGQLRAAEFEHLMERSWYAVTETCLAFTVFKDDFSPKFVALFVLLLFLKSFHWLAEDRVDFMERSPVITVLFHLRVLSLAVFLASLDVLFIQHAITSTITKGASVQLVFGFEYAVLLTIILNTLIKYVLHSVDLHSETPWENKAVFMLYTELFIGFIKVLLYVLFFTIMVRIFTLPLFAVRPMYLTMRAFKKAFNDVVLSRRAIHNMNTLYPDATAEELANSDNVCIICREEMVAPSAKKLPCGHIFHKSCLRSWFQRQQTCPTCRLDVLRANPQAAAPAAAAPAAGAAANFQQQVAALRLQLEQMQQQRQQQQHQNLPNLLNMMGIPPQVPQPQAAAAAAGNVGAPGGAAPPPTAPTPSAAAAGGVRPPPPFMIPPFPAFMGWNVPPPMPPANFQGMSEEELREMEGNERQHVEARIRCLRNVQVLLDAAVLEMQQYSAVVARCTTTTTGAATSAASSSSTSSSATASTLVTSTTSTAARSATSSSSPAVTPASSYQATAAANTAYQTTAAANTTYQTTAAANTAVDRAQQLKELSKKNDEWLEKDASSGNSSQPASPAAIAAEKRLQQSSSFLNTGARPKEPSLTSKTDHVMNETKLSSSSTLNSTTTPKDATPASAVSSETSPRAEDNPFANLAQTSEQDEIRRRRLAVFEEQKKRLMKM